MLHRWMYLNIDDYRIPDFVSTLPILNYFRIFFGLMAFSSCFQFTELLTVTHRQLLFISKSIFKKKIKHVACFPKKYIIKNCFYSK